MGEVRYSGANDICPPYESDLSRRNRSEAREVIRRFRALSAADQQALIEFLKQLGSRAGQAPRMAAASEGPMSGSTPNSDS